MGHDWLNIESSVLPNQAYTDPDFFRLEQERVFKNTWVFAAFAHKISNPGDLLPVQVAGQPIVLVRGDDSKIRAFHNVCRHRGAKLVDVESAGCRTIVCPNHSWSYSLSGKLLARPHFFGGDKHDVHPDGHPDVGLVAYSVMSGMTGYLLTSMARLGSLLTMFNQSPTSWLTTI